MATPSLTIAPGLADRAEGNELGVQFTFGVTRGGDSTVPISVRYRVSSTQASPDDFLDKNLQEAVDFPAGIFSMAAGETSKTLAILVSSDRRVEPDERFLVTLSDPVGAVIDIGSASGIIRNDDQSAAAPVYRFAKISTGAYFFTASQAERGQIAAFYPDFRPEGVGFFAYPEIESGAPVYRFANLSNGGYFYTGSAAERDATSANYPNMRFEGTTFSAAVADTPGALPVFRLANLQNGAYLYTTAPAERVAALQLGFWRDEGVSFYAPAATASDTSHELAGVSPDDTTRDAGASVSADYLWT